MFARQFPVIDAEGRVYPYMREARARGVWFDLGHGAASFWFRNAKRAIDDGFPPDSISSDLHAGSVRTTVHSMLDAMSKCLAMGMPMAGVIARSAITPAQAIRRPELGTLSPGVEAGYPRSGWIAVLELQRGEFSFRDCGYARIDADRKLACVLTLRASRIVYEADGRAFPHWRDAPEPYWRIPALQTGPIERLWRAHP